MPPVPPLRPIYQRSSKPLNTAAYTSVPATTQVIGYNAYLTTPGGTVLYQQNVTPIPLANAEIFSGPVLTTLGQAPTNGLAGVAPPEVAPPLTTGGSGSALAAGTYMVAIAWVTPRGTSQISPLATATITTGQFIEIQPAPGAYPAYVFGSLLTGFATATLIVPHLEDWHVTRYAIYVSSSKFIPSATVYVDSVGNINILDTTALGAQNSANGDLYLRPGQNLICVWTGADSGAQCTLSVFGEKTS